MRHLIFKTEMSGEIYIDAYRIDDKPSWILDTLIEFDDFTYIDAPSRTEAKRQAWIKWIDKDLIGFKEWHDRMMSKSKVKHMCQL